ncbi:hypothetical protein [Pediococcus acidilactici]|uniref:hypothetical protein n=1 Tax=Pediococcus acidilactici TaxID=1254 RepID=UPI001C260A3C|nr:hypothetical protein [Pediococcus acidilactici]
MAEVLDDGQLSVNEKEPENQGSSSTVVGELNFESSNHLVIRAFLVCTRKTGSSSTVVGELNFESSNHLVIRAFLVCMRKT